MKILITGAAGFIGSHLTDALIGKGHEIIGYDNLLMGSLDNLEQHRGSANFRFVQEDVRDIESLRQAAKGCEVLVHLAAMKIPRYGNSLETLVVNELGSANVYAVAHELGAKVVIASTSDVYGKSPALPFHEEGDLQIGPSSVRRWAYAASKIYDEHLGFAYAESHNLRVAILRFFGSYGPRQHLSWWGGPQSVFLTSAMNKEYLDVHGTGLQTRSFTFISDLIFGITLAVEKDFPGAEIFNLGSTEEMTILELAQRVYKLVHPDMEPLIKMIPYENFTGGKYEDVMRRIPDISKAKKMLGFDWKVKLDEGLRLTVGWHREAARKHGLLKS